jgi:hypothetical protein
MNQTETSYADMLQARVIDGTVLEWRFERKTFKLADDTRYTPDFEVILADGSKEYVDVKGSGPIDPKSLVKIKVAAEQNWEYLFVIEQKQIKKVAEATGNTWKRTEY